MGCNQSSVDPPQSNQQQVRPQLKKQSKSIQQNTAQLQHHPPKSKNVKKDWPLNPNNFNKLPEPIKDKYKKAKEKGTFEDHQFPRSPSSLGGPQYQEKLKDFIPRLVWLKPPQFFNSSFVLFDGIDPNDIKQGQLGVCYCLASVANYAIDPQKVVDIFPFYDLQLGFYVLRFYTNGKPNYVVVDDYFPCDSQSHSPLFTNPIGNQIWVILIEKAWAKVMGSYFSAEAMSADFFMEDFTGCPSYGAWFKDKEDKFQQIVASSNSEYLVVLTTGQKQIEGIVNGHAYSLLKVIQHEGSYIFKIRNPWGSFEWNGQYGEQSSLWTPQLRKKCGQQKGDDGVFFLSQSELLQAFQYYSIGLDQDNSKYSFVEFQSQPEESLYFKFKLTKTGNMAIRITQPFDRLIKDKDYKYSPVVLEVGKIESKDEVTFYSEGGNECYYGQKSVYATNEVYNEYQPGDYFVRVKMQWVDPKKYNTAVLSVYCGESVTIERIKQPEGFKIWKQLVYSFMQDKTLTDLDQNIVYGMEIMKGQLICYTAISENGHPNNYKIRWTFNSKEFKNCKLAINKTNDNVIEYTIDKKEKYNFGTVNHLLLSEQYEAGSAEVQVI